MTYLHKFQESKADPLSDPVETEQSMGVYSKRESEILSSGATWARYENPAESYYKLVPLYVPQFISHK